MKPGQRAVLLELAELDRLVDDQHLDGWWRPYQVRYFRPDNPIARRGTQLESVKSDLRALAAAGLVERREGKAALYRINDEGRRALQGEMIDEDTKHKMAELSISVDATVAQLVERIASLEAEVRHCRSEIQYLIGEQDESLGI